MRPAPALRPLASPRPRWALAAPVVLGSQAAQQPQYVLGLLRRGRFLLLLTTAMANHTRGGRARRGQGHEVAVVVVHVHTARRAAPAAAAEGARLHVPGPLEGGSGGVDGGRVPTAPAAPRFRVGRRQVVGVGLGEDGKVSTGCWVARAVHGDFLYVRVKDVCCDKDENNNNNNNNRKESGVCIHSIPRWWWCSDGPKPLVMINGAYQRRRMHLAVVYKVVQQTVFQQVNRNHTKSAHEK